MTHMRIKLLKPYMGHDEGAVIEVAYKLGERLVRDKHAKKMPGVKVKAAERTKG